ncbi:MAG: hypothetical protein ACRYFU_01035 [Janthinobacterium lividum]
MPKIGKKKRFLQDHPLCCFCGGTAPAITIDHVPPKACFPDGYCPDGFEFPACDACNRGSKKEDALAGFYTQLMDFNESNRTPDDIAKMNKLRAGILENYPDALPDAATSVPIHKVGSILTPMPVAISMERPSAFVPTMETLQRKLTHALYYKETGKPISTAHTYLCEQYQIQGSDRTMTTFLAELLPNETIGARPNIKNYGERFGYKSGFKDHDDLFLYGAQFGKGLILWGMVLGPRTEISAQADYLRSKPWRMGGTRENSFIAH